jgi:hypothetical protein
MLAAVIIYCYCHIIVSTRFFLLWMMNFPGGSLDSPPTLRPRNTMRDRRSDRKQDDMSNGTPERMSDRIVRTFKI